MKMWLLARMDIQDEQRFTFWVELPGKTMVVHNTVRGYVGVGGPCCFPDCDKAYEPCGHTQSVPLTGTLVMSLGFAVLGSHADVSGLCNHLRPC